MNERDKAELSRDLADIQLVAQRYATQAARGLLSPFDPSAQSFTAAMLAFARSAWAAGADFVRDATLDAAALARANAHLAEWIIRMNRAQSKLAESAPVASYMELATLLDEANPPGGGTIDRAIILYRDAMLTALDAKSPPAQAMEGARREALLLVTDFQLAVATLLKWTLRAEQEYIERMPQDKKDEAWRAVRTELLAPLHGFFQSAPAGSNAAPDK